MCQKLLCAIEVDIFTNAPRAYPSQIYNAFSDEMLV